MIPSFLSLLSKARSGPPASRLPSLYRGFGLQMSVSLSLSLWQGSLTSFQTLPRLHLEATNSHLPLARPERRRRLFAQQDRGDVFYFSA